VEGIRFVLGVDHFPRRERNSWALERGRFGFREALCRLSAPYLEFLPDACLLEVFIVPELPLFPPSKFSIYVQSVKRCQVKTDQE
jgi:hypothetical protein